MRGQCSVHGEGQGVVLNTQELTSEEREIELRRQGKCRGSPDEERIVLLSLVRRETKAERVADR